MKNRKTFRTAKLRFIGLLEICKKNMTPVDFLSNKEKTEPVFIDFTSMKYNIDKVYIPAYDKLSEESYKKIMQTIEYENQEGKKNNGIELTFAEIGVKLIELAEKERYDIAQSMGFGDNYQKVKPKKVVIKKKV